MLRDAAIALMKNRLSNIQDSDLDALILAELRHSQEDVLEREAEPYWFLAGKSDLLVAAEATSASLATSIYHPLITEVQDFIEWIEADYATWYNSAEFTGGNFLTRQVSIPMYAYEETAVPATRVPLEENTYPYLLDRYGEAASGTLPSAIARLPEGEDFYAFFTPALSPFYLRTYGYFSDLTLENNIENLWLRYASDLLLARTGQIIADQYVRYAQHALGFARQEEKARARLLAKDVEEKEQYLQYIRGGAD